MAQDHSSTGGHAHGAAVRLEPEAKGILVRGMRRLLDMTAGMEFRPVVSERSPFPLALAANHLLPTIDAARRNLETRMHEDPVSVLEHALVLLELYESNQQDISQHVKEDGPLLETCFGSKRRNGWIAAMGDADRAKLEEAVNARWQFNFYNGPARETGIYVLLNMLARYAFVYGRIEPGDFHALSHFVEDFTPGVIVVRGRMTDLELTLSLAAMKMGVPAVVPCDYPFPVGRQIRADRIGDIVEAVAAFPNVRKLLSVPGTPEFPEYARQENMTEKFEPARTWGATAESFYVVRKGAVERPGEVVVKGSPDAATADSPLGVIVTVDAEPMDAFDRRYMERVIFVTPSMISGVMAAYSGKGLVLRLRRDAIVEPRQIGEVLMTALRREFPRAAKATVELIFDKAALAGLAGTVEAEKTEREREIQCMTEESSAYLYSCVGCSPFAPDHVCIVTPERPPQCGRPYEKIKTGAHYGYDDMSNIHHSHLHRTVNSFGIIEKGRLLDARRGVWEGVNAAASALSHGRTTRIELHCLDTHPTTGCGCFNLIMFKTDKPRPGIGVMDNRYEGRSPDGRSWGDLHYSLAGKQTPGVSGASPGYLSSKKFLAAHGGWKSVVWVSPRIATIVGDKLPKGIAIG